MSSLRDSICVKSFPALPCRAPDCPVPSGLIASGEMRFFSTYCEVVGVEEMFFEARAVANSTVVAGALMSESGRLLP